MRIPSRQSINQSSRLMQLEGTPYKIAVPHHVRFNQYGKGHFHIGQVRFVLSGNNKVKVEGKIPDSWLIELDCRDESEGYKN